MRLGIGTRAAIAFTAIGSVGDTTAASAKATGNGTIGIRTCTNRPTPSTVKATRPSASSRMTGASRRSPSLGMRQPSTNSSGGRNSRKNRSGSSSTVSRTEQAIARAQRDLHDWQRQPAQPRQRAAQHDREQQDQDSDDRVQRDSPFIQRRLRLYRNAPADLVRTHPAERRRSTGSCARVSRPGGKKMLPRSSRASDDHIRTCLLPATAIGDLGTPVFNRPREYASPRDGAAKIALPRRKIT